MNAPFQPVKGIDNIIPALIQPKKIQLHSGLAGFDSPEAYGIYRHTGGQPLGVVGRVYEPPDLHLFLQMIERSIAQCADWLDIDQLEYVELKGGGKVRISIPGPRIELKTPMVGDVIEARLDFITGFDGLTKSALGLFLNRLWCGNGAARWVLGHRLAFKNTPGNQGKWLLFCDEIVKVLAQSREYGEFLNAAVQRKVTQKEMDVFFKAVLGFTHAEYKEQTTRKRNIFDRINQTVAIEMHNTGDNAFGLLQGVTRYTSHELAGGSVDALLFDTPAELTDKAHKAVAALLN